MIPDGYKAFKRHYPTVRQDVYDGYYGPRGLYMREDFSNSALSEVRRNYDMDDSVIERAENAGEFWYGTINVVDTDSRSKATLNYHFVDSDGIEREARFDSGWVGGGARRVRQVAVITEVLNKSPELRRLLLDFRESGGDRLSGASIAAGTPYLPQYIGFDTGQLIDALMGVGIRMTEDGAYGDTTFFGLSRLTFPSKSIRSARAPARNGGNGKTKAGTTRTKVGNRTPAKSKSAASKQRKPATKQPRKANGQFAKKPKGGRR